MCCSASCLSYSFHTPSPFGDFPYLRGRVRDSLLALSCLFSDTNKYYLIASEVVSGSI